MLFLHPLRRAYSCGMNQLSTEQSAYLLQHAHNPVDWWPWGSEALEAAAANGQWLLVSIGYSACHWCHVMEREIFEDAECAAYMNAHFRNIKVDREERPDLDLAYMASALALSGQGGWPLNVICLPDGRPIWASTYLPKARWLAALGKLVGIQHDHPEIAGPYATRLVDALTESAMAILPNSAKEEAKEHDHPSHWEKLSVRWDPDAGGYRGAPKFPLPATWWSALGLTLDPSAQEATIKHVQLTVSSILHSGSYDALRGGLFRYSTDAVWKVPHFEKMAYDNGLWLCLTGALHAVQPSPDSANAYGKTANWLQNEMRLESGLFAAAIDADTRHVEGASYTWSAEAIHESMGSQAGQKAMDLLDYLGNRWEGQYILHWPTEEGPPSEEYQEILQKLQLSVYQRSMPQRDDKSVHAWNAWILAGLASGMPYFKEMADATRQAAEAHWQHFGLAHSAHPRHVAYPGVPARGVAFLDDVAASIHAFITLAQSTMKVHWLERAHQLIHYAEKAHWDGQGYTYAAMDQLNPAFMVQYDWEDDVLPSGQALMARNLLILGHLAGNPRWVERAHQLVLASEALSAEAPSRFISWRVLAPHISTDASHLLLAEDQPHPGYIQNILWGPSASVTKGIGQVCTMSACTLVLESKQELHAYLATH